MESKQLRKITPLAGIATCIVLYSVILIAALPFNGEQGQTYSIFNHFISELGSFKHSVNHQIYNTGLILASIGFGTFTYGVKAYSSTKYTRIGVVIGLFSSVLCIGVGLVPEDYRIPHLLIALSFFSMMTVATAFFAWSIWKEQENPFPKYLAIHGFIIPVAFTLFMCMPKGLMAVKREQGPLFERPDIWWLPFFEWLIFFALTTWIISMSIQMIKMNKEQLVPPNV
jgi:hypothetical membrane protein